uniref:Uncharacterized protein n=1 Tax=Trichonephila inaurata madagascariensis TaxID=2747483 RepID=A0A8X7C0U0_9ARAC|nr:hypothetical protein TNIN_495821 [Trichonephila inaurata madagascariensis]
MEECSETSRDAIGGSDWDWIMRGRESVGDDQRPGQANTVITSDLIDKVDDLVGSDRRVTLRMFGAEVMSKKLYWDRPVKEWNLDFAIEILDRETIPNLVSYELKCQPDFNGLSLWLSESF